MQESKFLILPEIIYRLLIPNITPLSKLFDKVSFNIDVVIYALWGFCQKTKKNFIPNLWQLFGPLSQDVSARV